MIEIIYNNNGKKDASVIVKPPKNIRQIGTPRGRHKIYIEDYVYTYLHSALFEGIQEKRAAVLIGKSEVAQDIRYSFISGAISCEDFIFQENEVVFDESCWEYIYKEIKSYFDQQEVVGWFVGIPGFSLQLTPAIESAHRKYFTGREKVVFLSDPTEKEDVFYTYEQGHLQKKEGYYIYYEKNLPMQEYMVSSREKARESGSGIDERMLETPELEAAEIRRAVTKKQRADKLESYKLDGILSDDKLELETISAAVDEDQEQEIDEVKTALGGIEAEKGKTAAEEALQNYRAMLVEKKVNASQKKTSVLLYTASSVVLVVLCVIAITTLNDHEKMKNVEQTLSLISNSVEDTRVAGSDDEAEEDDLTIETISGEVLNENEGAQKEAAQTEVNAVENNQVVEEAEREEAAAPDNKEEVIESGTEEPSVEENEQSSTVTEEKATEEKATEEKVTEEQNNTQAEDDEAAQAMAQNYLQQGFYVVQPGDRLELICKKIYQTTAMMDELLEINSIQDGDKIYSGQKLILP